MYTAVYLANTFVFVSRMSPVLFVRLYYCHLLCSSCMLCTCCGIFIHQSIDCSSLHSSNLPAHMLCNFSSGNVTEFVLPKAYIGCDVYNTFLYISLCDVLFYYYCISMRTFYSMKQSFYHLFVAACICTVPHILILCCMYNVYTCVCVC